MSFQDLIKTAKIKTFRKGEIIFKENDSAESGLYYVISGDLSSVSEVDGKKVFLNPIPAKTFFGVIALVLNTKRNATVYVESEEARVAAFNKESFIKEAKSNPKFVKSLFDLGLERLISLEDKYFFNRKESNLYQPNPEFEKIQIENRTIQLNLWDSVSGEEVIHVLPNSAIFKDGDDSDGFFYLILEGDISLYKTLEGKQVEIWKKNTGDYFGYSTLQKYSKRFFTAQSEKGCRLLPLDQSSIFAMLQASPENFYYLFKYIVTDLIIIQSLYLSDAKEKAE